MMPGMPDLTQIVLQAQQMQASMERAQASLAEAEVTGSAGNGLVTAVVNGSGDLLRIRIDPSIVDPADVETLEDLVTAAVHDARRAAEDVASKAMGSVAGGLDLSAMGLGGLGLPGFGGSAGELEFDDDDDDNDDDDEFEDEGFGDDNIAGPGDIDDAVIVDEAPDGPRQPGKG
jgi:DNA-binding YbaB/EbfC family protein